MSEEPEIVPQAEARPAPVEVRQGWAVATVFAMLVCTAVALGGLAAPFLVPEQKFWIAAIGGGWLAAWFGLFALLLRLRLRRARAPGGWVLRAGPEGLQVNLRSFLNAGFDPADPTVLVVPRRRVRWLRPVTLDAASSHTNEAGIHRFKERRWLLDIALDADTAPVAEALRLESGRRTKGRISRGRHLHHTVEVTPDGLVRVIWRDRRNRLTPGLDEALRLLRPWFRFAEPGREAAPAPSDEDLLLAAVQRDDLIEAVKLARAVYDLDIGAARNFVESLRGGAKTP